MIPLAFTSHGAIGVPDGLVTQQRIVLDAIAV
jgi:hypothetical protein